MTVTELIEKLQLLSPDTLIGSIDGLEEEFLPEGIVLCDRWVMRSPFGNTEIFTEASPLHDIPVPIAFLCS